MGRGKTIDFEASLAVHGVLDCTRQDRPEFDRTDDVGHTTHQDFDALGRVVARTDPEGNTTAFTYDALGRTTRYEYDGQGRLTAIVEANGALTEYTFDGSGNLTGILDASGRTWNRAYDQLGRLASETDPLGHETAYGYGQGRLTAVVEANGARTEYTYDGTGNLTGILDAEGRSWSRAYDDLGRLASETDPLGHETGYTYDPLGNLKAKTNPDGSVVSYEYDVRRLTAVVLPGGARESFGYDALGRRTSMADAEVSLSFVYDALNRMTQATNQTLGQTIGYGYDAAGNRTSMDGPLGQVTYLYDAKNRLVEQHDPASGVYRLAYDAADRRTGLTYPNGVATEYDYDQASRLTDLLTRDPQGNVLDGYVYTYDAVGNRTEMRSLRDSAVHDYTYDSVDRLTRWQRGSNRFKAYTYDRVGNRTELDDERGSVTYSYDDANRLLQQVRTLTDGGSATTTDYGWDPNGNLLQKLVEGGSRTTYTWDALNRLSSVSDATGLHTYGYDPDGIRVRETNGTDTTRLLYAGEDIIGTYKSGSLDTYFAHGPGIDEPWARVNTGVAANPIDYLHHDGLGSVTAISNPQGQLAGATTYAPFGGVESTTTGLGTRYGYTSGELDPTGPMYYRARFLDPKLGEFLSKGRLGGSGTPPQTLNGYPYALNNPLLLTDPSGLFPSLLSALGGALGTFLIVLGSVVDAIGTYNPFNWQLGPDFRLELLSRLTRILGPIFVNAGLILYNSTFGDPSLTHKESVLKFWISVIFNIIGYALVAAIVGSIESLGAGALLGAALLFVGLNIVVTALVTALIEGTFLLTRRFVR